jgi:predicted nucleic acid-binding Zn ribbon protein
MKKQQAFELARQFVKDRPELQGEYVRLTETARQGYNAVTTIYRTRIGPRGGMGKSKRLNSTTNGTMIGYARVGDVITVKVTGRGLTGWHSYPVLPHNESTSYADDRWRSPFSLDDKIESLSWALENGAYSDMSEEDYLRGALYELESQKEWQERPQTCVECGSVVAEGEFYCDKCWEEIQEQRKAEEAAMYDMYREVA